MSELIAKEIRRGVVRLGEADVECSVLDNDERVLVTSQIQGLIGAGKDRMLRRFSTRIGKDSDKLSLQPRKFERLAGGVAYGYTAEDVVALFRALQRAFLKGELHHKQIPMAMAAMACIESFVLNGLVALIDEATGHQYDRSATDLRDRHARVLADHKQLWERTFDSEWDQLWCKLYGHPYEGRPPLFVKYWNDIAYTYAVGIDANNELKRRNPKPRFKDNHHQHLTQEAKVQLSQVISNMKALLKTSRTPSDFKSKLASVYQDMPLQLGWE